jgi:hypothetical protein
MNTIHVDINYTADDLQRSYTMHFKKLYPVKSKLLIIFGILIIGLGTTMLFLKGVFVDSESLAWFYVVFGFIAIAYYFWQYGTIGRRMFKKLPDFHSPFHYEISDQGIKTTSKTIDSDVKWDHYKRAIITDDMVLLYPNNLRYNLFPKRFFSGNDFDLLCTLIRETGISTK